MDLSIANQGGTNNIIMRDYRKGNWTLQETMVLIEAKKMDDERRMKRLGDGTERGKPAELRWKWVEDYCWKNGCLRSQNQCNDKWDNLMRDFKRVREYERRLAERGGTQDKSYWRMEKNERKDNNLPSNMLPQIYEALVGVVERKGQMVVVGSAAPSGSNANMLLPVVEKSPPLFGQPSTTPTIIQAPQIPLPLPSPAQTPVEPPIFPFSQPLPTVGSDSDTSEYTESPGKRRKTSVGGEGGSRLQEIGSVISKSASIIAEAIQWSAEREERRHRELLSLQERKLQIEESKAEINREGINGVVDAINKLANSILALADNKNKNQE